LAAATLIGLSWYLRPLDYRGTAGGQVRSAARITKVKVTGLALAFVIVLVLLFEAALETWGHERIGVVAIFALSGLEAMLAQELQRQTDTLIDQLRGAEAEEVVRRELGVLGNEGYAKGRCLARGAKRSDRLASSSPIAPRATHQHC
jgi:hypothetical protein